MRISTLPTPRMSKTARRFLQKWALGVEKSQFFDRISRLEQKNRNFLTELAIGSKKIAIF